MINKFKKRLSYFLIIVMMVGLFGVIPNNSVYASTYNAETATDGQTVNNAIEAMIEYFNTSFYREKGDTLEGWNYVAMVKAGADLSKNRWKLNPIYDKNPKTLGTKSTMAIIMLEVGSDPSNFDNRNLIKEMAEELEKIDIKKERFVQNIFSAIIAIDKFNQKYSDKKVSYDVQKVISAILALQKENGSIDVSINTSYAVRALLKHKDIAGVENAIKKALEFLKTNQKEDGAIYDKTFFTSICSEILIGLIESGADLKSNEWTKNNNTVIDGILKQWDNKGKAFFDKNGTKESYASYAKVLYTLAMIRDAGYGDYIVKGKIFVADNNEPEKLCKVNVAIVCPIGENKYDLMFKPSEVTISNKNKLHYGGFTAFGALQGATQLYEVRGSMITSIYGIQNQGLDGWVYTVNDKMLNVMAKDATLKNGDNVIWYYSKNNKLDPNGDMKITVPTWNEINGIKDNTINIQRTTKDEYYKLGSKATFGIKATNTMKTDKNIILIMAIFDKNNTLVDYKKEIKNIKANNSEVLNTTIEIPQKGIYTVKAFMWDTLENMNPYTDFVEIPVK